MDYPASLLKTLKTVMCKPVPFILHCVVAMAGDELVNRNIVVLSNVFNFVFI
jgi:hypothetical protein